MGGHVAPPVNRGQSSPTFFTFLVAFVALIFSHAVVPVISTDSSAASLLKFKSSLTNANGLKNWESSTDPCNGNWFGVICLDGQVWGLQLEDMHLSGHIDVDSLRPLPMLRSVSLMKNDFQGQMPDWKKLQALKSLFISDNHFEGDIPSDTFQGMPYLKKVHMANNQFTGAIPSSLSTPRLLELKIENNQFTGPIPELRDGITAFNVSNNLLEGPIPPSVEKMDLSSFSGNKGLCGKPVDGECGKEPDQDVHENSNSDPNTSPQMASHAAPKSKTSTSMIVVMVLAIFLATTLVVIVLLLYLRSRAQRNTFGFIVPSPYNQKNRSSQSSLIEVEAPPIVVVGEKVTKKVETGKLSFVREDRDKFDLQDLLRASAEVLGSGNFGSAYKAVLMDGKAVVVKRYKQMNNVDREDFHEHMRRLGRLQHPNLLPMVAYYYRKEEKLLVFDHVQNGSLAGRLHGKHSDDKPSLDWPQRLKIVKGIGKGLLYLQSQLPSVTVGHGHLKSTNVLIDKDCNPLLMDYALVPVVNSDKVHQLLVSYKSPEYTQTRRVTMKTDVWCLGIIILEILTGKMPANYVISQDCGYDSVLAGWVNEQVSGEKKDVFDPEIGNTEDNRGEMKKLLMIAASCCEEDVDKRLDLTEALEEIEDVKEKAN